VSSDAMTLRTLTELADKQISRAIQTVNGVGQVTIAGSRAREIHIVVDIEKLNSYGLSISQVRDAVVAENVEIPGGAVEQGKGQLLLRTMGRIDAAADFNSVVVSTKNGTPIRISDLGYAEDSFERPTSSVWLGDKPAVQLDIRPVIIAALAIPASIIAAFTLMNLMGFTLNNMTLLGITLAVGIVIDDAIVVLENIFRYIEEKGVSPFEAAIQGTREVALAVMATTLSLVVIFLPIAFMNGYAKRFINPFGWTMAFSIMVSMLVSFTLTPMLSSRFLRLSDAVADHKTKERGFFHWLDQWYARQVTWALDHSGVIIALSIVTFLF